MKKILYSVVIPTLNEELWVGGLLSDLASQNYKDLEVIVVDARSRDKTKKVANKYKKRFNRFLFKESRIKNVSYQRNMGAGFARGEYILFIDADTRVPKDFLKNECAVLLKSKPDLFSNWFSSTRDTPFFKLYGVIGSFSYWILVNIGLPAAPGTLLGVKRTVFRKLGGFSETIPFAEDRELVRRAFSLGFKFRYFTDPKYLMSLRRIEKRGIIKYVLIFILVNIKRELGIQLDRKKEYPMGGKYD